VEKRNPLPPTKPPILHHALCRPSPRSGLPRSPRQGPLPPRSGAPPDAPGFITIPRLQAARVSTALATIFTESGGITPGVGYDPLDPPAAHFAGLAQLAAYHRLFADTLLAPISATSSPNSAPASPAPLRVGLLLENADPVRSPDELAWWASQGVVAVGLTWARSSRYATGNSDDSGAGLTPLGRAMVDAIDHLHLAHDLSHLSDPSLDQLLSRSRGRVFASHSNVRRLLNPSASSDSRGTPPHPISLQRHLPDWAIREIAARDGVIGLNLFSPFLSPQGSTRRATLDETIAHLDAIASLLGHTRTLALGSDVDGGFSGNRLPDFLNHPRDLHTLLNALSSRGWSDADLHAFAHGNAERFLRLNPA
jgi:membrane dipeptidase